MRVQVWRDFALASIAKKKGAKAGTPEGGLTRKGGYDGE